MRPRRVLDAVGLTGAARRAIKGGTVRALLVL